jgi:hypothetical protein
MAEYIEREAAAKLLRKEAAAGSPTAYHIGLYAAARAIEAIPAADVRPVVRGTWKYNPGDNIPYCSECMMPQDSECNYCPNCGADMREGR